jgi:hypothetical protein
MEINIGTGQFFPLRGGGGGGAARAKLKMEYSEKLISGLVSMRLDCDDRLVRLLIWIVLGASIGSDHVAKIRHLLYLFFFLD